VGVNDYARSDTYIGVPADSSSYRARTEVYRFTAERGAPSDRWGLDIGAEREATDASLSTGLREGLGTTSGFAVLRFRPFEPLTLTAAGRYDAPDSFQASATGHASAVLKLPAGFTLEGAWGQGFKTPTISEIACDFCFPGGPSLGLKPEHAVGWDGTLAWASGDGRFTARLTGYRLAVRDQIAFASTFPFRYVNLARTRTDGLEAEAHAQLSGSLSVDAEYAYTDAIDLVAHTQMLRVPRNAGSVTLNWTHGHWQAAFTVRAEGADADINPSTFVPQRRPGFVIANLAGSYALTPRLELTARIDDIANTRYEEALGYGEPRQMIFFGVRARD
jgi:vitamin B12 transporter